MIHVVQDYVKTPLVENGLEDPQENDKARKLFMINRSFDMVIIC